MTATDRHALARSAEALADAFAATRAVDRLCVFHLRLTADRLREVEADPWDDAEAALMVAQAVSDYHWLAAVALERMRPAGRA